MRIVAGTTTINGLIKTPGTKLYTGDIIDCTHGNVLVDIQVELPSGTSFLINKAEVEKNIIKILEFVEQAHEDAKNSTLHFGKN